MKNDNFYKLLGGIALEYRLSLDNLCRILGKPINEENKKAIYNSIISSINGDHVYVGLYKYLFNYETINEDEITAVESYKQASKFLGKYSYAKSKGSNEDVLNVLMDLRKTEENFKKIEQKDFSDLQLIDEIEIISKYRIKFTVPRMVMAKALNVTENKIRRSESKLNPILKSKVELLSEYCEDKSFEIYRSKR